MMTSTNVMASVQAAIVRERLRQATCSFNVALCGMAVCTLAGTIGLGLIIFGKTQEGCILTTGGVVPITICMQFAKEANERLDVLCEENGKVEE
jgi:hypothetical protein